MMKMRTDIPREVAEALANILYYLWDMERNDYEDAPKESHIFLRLCVISKWLYGMPE